MPLTDLQAMIATVINVPSSLIWNLLIYLLLGCGLFFTVRTRFIQFRLLGRGWCEMAGSRHHVNNHSDISPFQAFATGLASRVGSGNIAGVATAISVGGPGAIFSTNQAPTPPPFSPGFPQKNRCVNTKPS